MVSNTHLQHALIDLHNALSNWLSKTPTLTNTGKMSHTHTHTHLHWHKANFHSQTHHQTLTHTNLWICQPSSRTLTCLLCTLSSLSGDERTWHYSPILDLSLYFLIWCILGPFYLMLKDQCVDFVVVAELLLSSKRTYLELVFSLSGPTASVDKNIATTSVPTFIFRWSNTENWKYSQVYQIPFLRTELVTWIFHTSLLSLISSCMW